jgi:hypothetical protein
MKPLRFAISSVDIPPIEARAQFGPTAGYQSPTRQKTADAAQATNGRLLISVLLEFWLTDGDLPLPLPPNAQGSPDLLAALNTSRSPQTLTPDPN